MKSVVIIMKKQIVMTLGLTLFGLSGIAPLLTASPQSPPGPHRQHHQVDQLLAQLGDGELLGDSPTLGAEDPVVQVIKFSDFQCPYCGQTHPLLKQLISDYGDQVQLVYKHYPLVQIHPEAMPAAQASWAAQQQGKFWEYQDELFDKQGFLGEALYVSAAEKLDLDLDQFNQDRRSRAARQAVNADLQLGRRMGVSSTPTLLVNGQIVRGVPSLEHFEAYLDQVEQEQQ